MVLGDDFLRALWDIISSPFCIGSFVVTNIILINFQIKNLTSELKQTIELLTTYIQFHSENVEEITEIIKRKPELKKHFEYLCGK